MMIDLPKSAYILLAGIGLLTMDLVAAHCAAASASQLQRGDYENVLLEGFPAIAKDGDEVAILTTTHPMRETYLVEIRRVDSDAAMKKFTIVSEAVLPTIASVEAAMVEPNAYLRLRAFKPMKPLFSLNWNQQTRPLPKSFEQESLGLHMSVDYESFELTISSKNGGAKLFRIKPATQDIGQNEHCAQFAGGMPTQGWIDQERGVVAILVSYSATRDGCEAPDLWHVVRLDAAK